MSKFSIYKVRVSPKGNTTLILKSDARGTLGSLHLQSVVSENAFCWHTFAGNHEQSFTQLQQQNAVVVVDSPDISVADADGKGGGKLLLSPNSHLKVFVNGVEQIASVAEAPSQ